MYSATETKYNQVRHQPRGRRRDKRGLWESGCSLRTQGIDSWCPQALISGVTITIMLGVDQVKKERSGICEVPRYRGENVVLCKTAAGWRGVWKRKR